MSFVGLVPSERSSGEAPPTGLDHESRLQPRAAAARRVRLARQTPTRPSATSSGAATAARTRPCSSARGAASSACIAAGSRMARPRQAPPEDRRRLRPRTRRIRLGDRHRPAAEHDLRPTTDERGVAGGPSQKENPRFIYAAPARGRPATLDRGSSRRTPVMRSRPANVSLTHRRCPGTPATPRPPRSAPPRAGP